MKKLITMSVCIFTLTFFYPANTGFSDILKDLQNFTESLGDVVTQISELDDRISTLESENKSKEKQIAEYNQSMDNIEAHLNDLDANVERVANMASLKGVKDIVKEFEGTLKVFKKRFAKLDNRVEDQEVKTSVLEKMYKQANLPLETLMQTLDEQKRIIEGLEGKLKTQETLISSMKDNLDRQASLATTLGIEDIKIRIDNLESSVSKHPPDKHVTTTHDDHDGHAQDKHVTTTHDDHDGHAQDNKHITITHDDHDGHTPDKDVTATHDDHDGHTPDQYPTIPGLIDIDEGFFVKNIKFKTFGSSSQINGELVNKSEMDYGMMDFELQAYDTDNVPLGGLRFSIYGFEKDKVVSFEEIIAGIELKKIAKYSIQPTQMQIVSDAGDKTIKMIERELTTANDKRIEKTAAEEIAPENLEDLLFDETSPDKLEGLEDIGNGFFASNISFSGFGSSSTVESKKKNNSKEDFYNASFVMKIFSKKYGMITSLDFSVRSINSGDTKTFDEIIAGVSPIDIERYEISFKSSY